MKTRPLSLITLIALALAGAPFALASCADLKGDVSSATCANQDVFEASVSPYMEKRCGTLDCHGGVARPMRLYGNLGLRHPNEGNVPGGDATTKLERESNYLAVCNLQPEKMTASVANFGNDAETLLVVQKARNDIKHKGGKVVNGDGNDPGDLCIVKWLQLAKPADVDEQCQLALKQLNH